MLEKSQKIIDFYVRANDNKHRIKINDKNRNYSIAEVTILSCIDAIARHSVYGKGNNDWDISKVIRMILYSSLEGKMDNLKNKELYNNLLTEYKSATTIEASMAKVSYYKVLFNEKNDNEIINRLLDNYSKLRTTIRIGHIYWGAKGERLESILEHIYGTLVILLGVESEYNLKLKHDELLIMLLLHETEEIKIGDLTDWDISKEKRRILGKKAVKDVLCELDDFDYYNNLIDKFNEKKTPESKYANSFDKLEYDMQVKMYELYGRYDFEHRPQNVATTSSSVRNIISKGANTVFDVHYEYDKSKFENNPYMKSIFELTKKM